MVIFRKVDKNGMFVEDVLDPIIEEVGKNLYIAEPVPQGFYHPKWNGTEWGEGLSDEEIVDRIKQEIQEPTELDYLMLAMVDLDTQRAFDKIEAELAITELAEIILGGV